MLAKYLFLRKRFEKSGPKIMNLSCESEERKIFHFHPKIPQQYHTHTNSKLLHQNYNYHRNLKRTNFARLSRQYFALVSSMKDTPTFLKNNNNNSYFSKIFHVSNYSNFSIFPKNSHCSKYSHSFNNSNNGDCQKNNDDCRITQKKIFKF